MSSLSEKNPKCTVKISLGNSNVVKSNMKLSQVKGAVSTELANLLRDITSEVERKLNEAKAIVTVDGRDYEIPIKTTVKIKATPYVSGALLEHFASGEEPTIEFNGRYHWTLYRVSIGIKNPSEFLYKEGYRLLYAMGYITDRKLTPKGVSTLTELSTCDLPDHEIDTAFQIAYAITHPWVNAIYATWLKARGYLTTDNERTEEGENWLRSHVKLAMQSNHMHAYDASLYDLFLKYLPENTLHELYAICTDGGHRALRYALDRHEKEQDEYLKTQPPK